MDRSKQTSTHDVVRSLNSGAMQSRAHATSDAAGPRTPEVNPSSKVRFLGLLAEHSVLLVGLALLAFGYVNLGVPGWPTAAAVAALVAAAWFARRPPQLIAKVTKVKGGSGSQSISGLIAAVDAISDPCFIAGTRGQVVHANDGARQRFGRIDVGDPVSFKLRVPTFLEALERVNAGGPQELIGWSEKVPTERWFQAFLSPIRLARESRVETGIRPDYTLILVRDLTEQNRLERMRADFVANASHELRTPLTTLTGMIETLQGPAREDEKARVQFLSLMHDQASRMRRLIDDLLSLSRIEMTSHLLPTERVELGGVIEHVIDSLRQVIDDAGVKINLSLPDHHVMILGDHDELVQVFQNLIENAVKYAASGERIDISLSCDPSDGDILISVRDYGPGIAAEHVPRLTERFYRVDQEVSRRAHGTGLGLAIVKHILTKHGSTLEVDSTLGTGSSFSARFKRAPVDLDRNLTRSRTPDSLMQK